MATVNDLYEDLGKLIAEGHGSLPVIGCDSSSGAYGEVSTPYVDDTHNDMGPFDVPLGERYVCVSVGH